MTTTDPYGGYTPPPATPEPAPPHVLRRSRTDRVGAGVAGGLGEYFGVDPVLFRVLFATAAFFGGAGVLAYLLAWAAIPEQGTAHAPIDRFVASLRQHRVPVWLVAVVVGLVLWGISFSWWAPRPFVWWGPRPFIPILVVVIILVALFGRHARRTGPPPPPATPWQPAPAPASASASTLAAGGTGPVNLEKTPGDAAQSAADAQPTTELAGAAAATWVGETKQWFHESRAASRERRRRAFPIRITAVAALVTSIGILAAIDAASGVDIPVYFWVTLSIVVAALLVGMVLRRTPWSLASLITPCVIGLVAFGGTSAQLHDGFGQRDWTPTAATGLQSNYRLAFGQAILDLSNVPTATSTQTVHITVAAGQVRIVLPSTLNATVDANVHFGIVEVDGNDDNGPGGVHSRGANVNRTILPPATATGLPFTIDVHLADGNISIDHQG